LTGIASERVTGIKSESLTTFIGISTQSVFEGKATPPKTKKGIAK